MAPTPPDNTARLWVDYTSAGRSHAIMFRYEGGGSPAEAAQGAQGPCTALASVMRSSDRFVSARYAEAGSNLSFPAPWVVIPGTASNDNVQGDPESRYITIVGRGTVSGCHVFWRFFTASNALPIPVNNRFAPQAAAPIDAIVQAFVDATTPETAENDVLTIQGDRPQIYTYVNSGFDGYWQRKQRRGG